MKNLASKFSCACGKFVAPLALALAVLTVNSTCWLFSCQPDVPKTMTKYMK